MKRRLRAELASDFLICKFIGCTAKRSEAILGRMIQGNANDSMELLKVTEAFVPGAKCQLEGVTASFTQPLDAANDSVTLIPNCDLGAEFLGSEVGFVFVGLQQGISLNGFSVLYGPSFGNSSLTIEAEGSKRDGWLETGWLLITLEHLRWKKTVAELTPASLMLMPRELKRRFILIRWTNLLNLEVLAYQKQKSWSSMLPVEKHSTTNSNKLDNN
ncbi:hypothetical protein Cgig2_018330 [Carnegiea gigantea]|uniref:Uncharacterized protein n=1 Tax=Carnegiea gigantea TaxID=171969 RepID=A0A9Q1QS75_9CARY|nr:hypothetical protein Cgig2_018330 [Carnegiea gigantea]